MGAGCQQGWFLLRPLCLAWGCLLFPVSSNGLSFVFVCVLISFSYKGAAIGLGTTHTTLFYLHYVFDGPVLKDSCILNYWGVGEEKKFPFYFSRFLAETPLFCP